MEESKGDLVMINKLKGILEEQHNREFTMQEAKQAFWDLQNLARIQAEYMTEEFKRLKKLKEFPEGFQLEDTGVCSVCNKTAKGEDSWYDKNGVKCRNCQNAINTKIIPISIVKNPESWYSSMELNKFFNIQSTDLKKYIKQDFLKQRLIKNESDKIHLQLFLIEDNKNVLPPKKLLKSRSAKVDHKGEEYYTTEQWYEFVDEKVLMKLRKYRIVECFKDTFSKPINP